MQTTLVGPRVLRPLQYAGTPSERASVQRLFDVSYPPHVNGTPPTSAPAQPEHNILVLSYDSLRADIDWLCSHGTWLYCVLDEGHAIRNPKSRLSQAAKRVTAHHRLILSGTPIQNDVLEMWALFDWLMPGLLGSEREFNAKYGKALQVRGDDHSAAGHAVRVLAMSSSTVHSVCKT